MLSNVDFPDPEEPIMATISPSATLKLIPFKTFKVLLPIE
jgi:hypothetical protein